MHYIEHTHQCTSDGIAVLVPRDFSLVTELLVHHQLQVVE